MMDSYSFASYYNIANMNGGGGEFFSPERMQRIQDYQSGKITTEIPADGDKWANSYMAGNADNDWYDIYYKNFAFAQNHNLSLSGGTDKVNYYVSLGYLGQDGLIKVGKEHMDRYNVSAKVNAKLSSWAQMSYSMRFIRKENDRPSDLTNSFYNDLARQGWPVLPLYDPNGYVYTNASPYKKLANGGKSSTQGDDTSHQLSFIFEPIKNWITHVDLNYRISSQDWHWDQQITYNHDVAGNAYPSERLDSQVHESHSKNNYSNINVYSKYSYSIEDKHNLHAMLGFQSENNKQTQFGLNRLGIIVPELPEIDITTGLDHFGNPVSPTVNGSRNSWSTAGFFGRLNYDYKGKYLAEVNLRYDGTSRFRQDQRWNLFPSFSLGWNISQEDFWKSFSDVCNMLKLRASYGELGNQNTNNWYQTYQVISVNAASGSWLQNGMKPNVASTPALVSSSLGWETI